MFRKAAKKWPHPMDPIHFIYKVHFYNLRPSKDLTEVTSSRLDYLMLLNHQMTSKD